MNTRPPETLLPHDEILLALAALGEDPRASRADELRALIDASVLPVDGREAAVRAAVDTARNLLDGTAPHLQAQPLKFVQTDMDNCRVYYRGGDTLYAFQRERAEKFAMYVCTGQGEPMYPVDPKPVELVPQHYAEFARWVSTVQPSSAVARDAADEREIVAYFWPQEFRYGKYRDLDGAQPVDVTAKVLALTAEEISEMEDDTDSTNDLVDYRLMGHEGPHRVEVVESICEFFDVDEIGEITQELVDEARLQAAAGNSMPAQQPGGEGAGVVKRGPAGGPWLVVGSGQDRNTILAALRFYQERGMGDPANRSDAIHDIATNGDEDISMDAAGIDDLCMRLQESANEPPRLSHASINEALQDAGIRAEFKQAWKLCEALDEKPLYHREGHFPAANKASDAAHSSPELGA